ncbi:MAG: CBS domain-containing protein [Clostridia bacterium]|nr:CBS domain-containing protein [Clostridia bacterium]
MENKEKSNAVRFIDAYNKIDYSLRVQNNYKRSMSFSDMIRKAVVVNHIVRKYEDDLIDFGRLRNAIIHKSNDKFLIAEPHIDVVEKMEKIAKLVATPPKVIETNCVHDVFTVSYDVTIMSIIEIMAQTSYSNIPVFKDGVLIGVANGQKIIDAFGKYVLAGGDANEFLHEKTVEYIVNMPTSTKYYEVVSVDISVEEIMNLFFTNRKLLCVILTKYGKMGETPVGIITASDYMELNKILENY